MRLAHVHGNARRPLAYAPRSSNETDCVATSVVVMCCLEMFTLITSIHWHEAVPPTLITFAYPIHAAIFSRGLREGLRQTIAILLDAWFGQETSRRS